VCSQIQFRSGCTGLSGGAPDSVRCARTSLGEQFALRTRRRRTTINHRTVRWCTGLSGESSAAKSSLSRKAQRRTAKNHQTVRWCTGLSGEPTVGCSIRADAWPSQRSDGGTGLSGVHRTVSGAAPNLQRSAAPN
jgi:adenylylsulfate kinase-like enzyme